VDSAQEAKVFWVGTMLLQADKRKMHTPSVAILKRWMRDMMISSVNLNDE
jgi:hypothetical protein